MKQETLFQKILGAVNMSITPTNDGKEELGCAKACERVAIQAKITLLEELLKDTINTNANFRLKLRAKIQDLEKPIVGVSTQHLDGNVWKYILECLEEDESKGFCGEFTINASVAFEPQTFESPESCDVELDWSSIDYDKESFNLEAMKAWVEAHQSELEAVLGEEDTKIR